MKISIVIPSIYYIGGETMGPMGAFCPHSFATRLPLYLKSSYFAYVLKAENLISAHVRSSTMGNELVSMWT